MFDLLRSVQKQLITEVESHEQPIVQFMEKSLPDSVGDNLIKINLSWAALIITYCMNKAGKPAKWSDVALAITTNADDWVEAKRNALTLWKKVPKTPASFGDIAAKFNIRVTDEAVVKLVKLKLV